MNNLVGHGFYQFSPELYASIFSEANGDELVNMLVHEETRLAKCLSVVNPDSVAPRVTLINSVPTTLMITAKRTKRTALFEPLLSKFIMSVVGIGIHRVKIFRLT
jgi:hypothetical protein